MCGFPFKLNIFFKHTLHVYKTTLTYFHDREHQEKTWSEFLKHDSNISSSDSRLCVHKNMKVESNKYNEF